VKRGLNREAPKGVTRGLSPGAPRLASVALTGRKREPRQTSSEFCAWEPTVPTISKRITCLSLTAGALLAFAPPTPAAASFNSVVKAILDSRTDGPLAEMDANKRSKMTACVIEALQPLPSGSKKKIVAGKNLSEQARIFGQVVDENHAKWRQNIAKACSEIATED
jgi:hypothetical protein